MLGPVLDAKEKSGPKQMVPTLRELRIWLGETGRQSVGSMYAALG